MFNVYVCYIAARTQCFIQRIDEASMIMNGAYSQWLFVVHV